MLSESSVTILVDEKEQVIKIKDLYDLFLVALNAGKKTSIQIKAYDTLKQKFGFKPIRNVKPVPQVSKIKCITLDFTDVEKDSYAKVLLDLNTKVWVKNSNLDTSVNVGFIDHVGKKPMVGFVENDKIIFKKLTLIKDYTTPVEEPKVEVKKRGRKPKVAAAPTPEPVKLAELRVFNIELPDGSLILCDNLLQR